MRVNLKTGAVTRTEGAENQLQKLIDTDPLTGLWNRRGFLRAANEVIRVDERNGLPTSVLMIDIDNFKQFNDQFGHMEGDNVLRYFAGLFEPERDPAIIRRADVVGRFGGEEFCVLLSGADIRSAMKTAERLRLETAKQSLKPQLKANFTISIGVAMLSGDEALGETINRADKALYHSKSEGRNRVTGAELTGVGGAVPYRFIVATR